MALVVAHVFVVFVGVVSHEPWFDEAQSWLLARDAPVGELLTSRLRLEGHPPLWYLLLAPLAKGGFPYLAANVLSATCAVVGVLVFLSLPAIPWPVRLVVPFGYYVAYQYAVVARSYALVLPLLMGLAALYPRRRRRVVAGAALLVALACVSLHGLAIAWALAALHALELRKEPPLDRDERRRHAVALGALLAATGVLVLVLWPPADVVGMVGLAPAAVAARLAAVFRLSVLGAFGAPPGGGALFTAAAAAVALASLAWFRRQRLLLVYLLPTAGVFAVSGLVSSRWHEGLFFLVWLFVLVVSFQRPAPTVPRALATALAVAVLGLHAFWGARALRYDVAHAYSGAAETAAYLRTSGLDRRRTFGAGFSTLALEPYFGRPLLANYRAAGRYWDWSRDDPLFRPGPPLATERVAPLAGAMLREAPEVIVVGLKFASDGLLLDHLAQDPRYRVVARFDGALGWKGRRVEPEAFAVLARVGG